MKNLFFGITALLCFVLPYSYALSETIVVPYDKATIQEGIEISKDGDTILVAPGLYVENIDFLDRAITVTTMFGPDSTFLLPADPDTFMETIAGANPEATEFSGFNVSGGGANHTVFINNASSPVIRDNVFCNNLVVDKLDIAVIACWDSVGVPTIERNIFYQNSGLACVWIMYGKGYVINCTFDANNSATMCNSEQATVLNCIMTRSLGTATDGSYAELDYVCYSDNHLDFG